MSDDEAPLDAAVTVARQYVAQHPDTLLVVTGDHECGGLLTIEGVDAEDETGTGDSLEDGPFPIKGPTPDGRASDIDG